MAEMVDVEDRDIDEVVCNELGSFWDQSVDQDEKDNSCRPQFVSLFVFLFDLIASLAQVYWFCS